MGETQQANPRVVVVTGAGSGIGLGIARAFARTGAHVALSDMDGALAASSAKALCDELGAGCVQGYQVDVADLSTQNRMVDDVLAREGRLDVVVANAGMTVYKPAVDFTAADFDRVVSVNLRGTFFLAQRAAREMLSRGTQGRIVLLSSVLGALTMRNSSVYSMTKAGIVLLARSLGLELGGHGITVNAVAPGATLTDRTAQETGDYQAEWGGVAPTGRVATVDDIASAVTFLASPEARQINGHTLYVDGGWTGVGRVPSAYV